MPERSPSTDAFEAHLPELDWLKGAAIISVACIHASFLSGTFLFIHFINRAVPVFLVLFGITSELWWERTANRLHAGDGRVAASWYRARAKRLLPPVWSMLFAWFVVASWSSAGSKLTFSARDVALSAIGFTPWIGTSWFITVILQLVLLFPALRWVSSRVGVVATLSVSLVICVVSTYDTWDIVVFGHQWIGGKVIEPGWYYQWIFSPRVFWDVLSGVFVTRYWRGRLELRGTLIAIFLTIVGFYLIDLSRSTAPNIIIAILREQAAYYVIDVPLAIALLGVFRIAPLPGFVHSVLGWLGRYSWGIYIGHLLVHEAFHLNGIAPEMWPWMWVHGVYAMLLLCSGALLAALGAKARGIATALT